LTTWAGLEDYILDNADNRDLKVSVFTGPVLAADDDAYRGVQLPRQFWKVVVMVKESGELSATGYLLSPTLVTRTDGPRRTGSGSSDVPSPKLVGRLTRNTTSHLCPCQTSPDA
jgi:DNA/RNA endonuclease G (NUC1)